MTTAQVRHYRDLSAEYLRKARAHLDEGDLLQASEKGWGAAAVLLKAIAEESGWRHNHHRYLWHALQRLADESGDEEMRDRFSVANALHMNYYEDWLDAKTVARNLGAVERLVESLEQVDNFGGAP